MEINKLKDFGVDIDNALELLGDVETYNEILNDFYIEIDDRITNLTEYKNNNDLENYNILVHTIKSDAKYLGFNDFSNLCLEHQLKSENNDTKYILDNFDNLINEFNKIKEIIEKYQN